MAKRNPKKKRRQRPLGSDVNEPQHRKEKLEKRKSERRNRNGQSIWGGGGEQDNKPPSHWHFWVPYNSNNNKEAAVDLLWLTVMRRTSWHFCFCFIFCFLFWQDNEINTQPDTNSSSRNVLQSLQTHTHTFIYINCKASVGADREHTTKKRRRGKNLTR